MRQIPRNDCRLRDPDVFFVCLFFFGNHFAHLSEMLHQKDSLMVALHFLSCQNLLRLPKLPLTGPEPSPVLSAIMSTSTCFFRACRALPERSPCPEGGSHTLGRRFWNSKVPQEQKTSLTQDRSAHCLWCCRLDRGLHFTHRLEP